MPKKAVEKIENIKYKKYIFKLQDNSILLINSPNKLEAIKILSNRLTNNYFEDYNFEVIKVAAEIKEDGTVIKYIEVTEEE